MSQIGLESITKTFGAVRALDNVSLDIAQGELMTLLGPSGCGKTTLLRVVSGLEQPDSGRVLIGGKDFTQRTVIRCDSDGDGRVRALHVLVNPLKLSRLRV